MTTAGRKDGWLAAAQKIARRLSEPAAVQLLYLQTLGVQGSIDELGLEFHDVWNPLEPLLMGRDDLGLWTSLRALDRALSNESLEWTDTALRNSPAWETIRRLAHEALVEMSKATDV